MMRAPRSLLARILWWHGIAVLVTAAAVSAGVYLFLDATAGEFQRQTLRLQASSLHRDLVAGPDGAIRLAEARGRERSDAGVALRVLDADGRVLLAPPSTVRPPAIDPPRLPREAYFTRRSRQAFYAGLSVPTRMAGRPVWIVAIQNLDHPANVVDDVARHFFAHGIAVILPLLLLLLGVDALIVRRALRPVRRASALMRTLDPARPDIRVAEADQPTEVRPLAAAVNAALDRLTDSLRMQRDFTADAAHELRTPITIARMRTEEVADPALRDALKADLDVLARTVGHLLEIAELDTLDRSLERTVDLVALAEQGVAAIAPLAFRGGRRIALDAPPAPVTVRGQAELIARALNALMENAVKHTPPGTRIEVRVTPATLSVIDDGPGIATEEQPLVFRRFWRSDRAAPANAGLGLAIVDRVAKAHGGEALLGSRPGRTVFTLRFPDRSGG